MTARMDTFTRPLRAGFAAPTGRTRTIGGWGCLFTLIATTTLAFDVPSERIVEFQESFLEEQEDGALWGRFRFVMPALADRAIGYSDVASDLMTLCRVYAAPSLTPPFPELLVISLAEQPTEFGTAAPEVRQIFESFLLKSGDCIWGDF